MRLYKVVLLVNLALGVGFVLSSLWWSSEVGRLRRELESTRSDTLAGSPDERQWSIRGIVRVVAPEINRIFIEHADIPGLMEAMTMAFEPDDPRLFDGLSPGDQVRFTIRKEGERLVLIAIAKEASP